MKIVKTTQPGVVVRKIKDLSLGTVIALKDPLNSNNVDQMLFLRSAWDDDRVHIVSLESLDEKKAQFSTSVSESAQVYVVGRVTGLSVEFAHDVYTGES